MQASALWQPNLHVLYVNWLLKSFSTEWAIGLAEISSFALVKDSIGRYSRFSRPRWNVFQKSRQALCEAIFLADASQLATS